MSDKVHDIISDMETGFYRAKRGARLLANMICDEMDEGQARNLKGLPGKIDDGLIFVAEQLEDIINDLAERRDALRDEIVRTRAPQAQAPGPREVVKAGLEAG